MTKPRVVIYTNTDQEKENYKKIRSVLQQLGMTFSHWGNMAIEYYLLKKDMHADTIRKAKRKKV